jgi:hypothetical protein
MSIIFDNFECTPMGNAQLNLDTINNKLVVSNIGPSGLDGVMINIANNDHSHVYLNPITDILNGGVIRFASIGKNALNQVITTNEDLIWLDNESNKIKVGYNMGFLPSTYNVFGTLNGNTVFEIQKQNPLYDDSDSGEPSLMEPITIAVITLVVAVATLATSIWALLKPSSWRAVSTTYHPDGSITRTVTTGKDPDPFEIEVDGQIYIVDNFGIKFKGEFSAEDAYRLTNEIGLQITGYNLSNNIEITSISAV